ncbi:MAG: hypothetical protein IKW64_00865 [Clostridia bacterium]|nr:hypothetical protein [Clostridia bacterium]
MSIVLYFFVRKIPLEAVAIGDSLDWKNLTASEISDRVLKKVKPGSIVLFHNAALHTPEALPTIIENLQKDGYKIVPVSQIILKENFTIDNSGMQIPTPKNTTEAKNGTSKTDAKTPSPTSSETQKANTANSTAPAFIPVE